MKIMSWKLAFLVSTGVLITSCCNTCGRTPTQMATNAIQRQSITTTTHQELAANNPQNVTVYNYQANPRAAYRVIGVAKVSKRNLLGMARPSDTIDSMMKKLAASIGGDGLIDVHQDNNEVQGKVIATQKILI